MSKADPGRPDPVSLRENVWPGRTALIVHCASGAVRVPFTITWKPCSRSWLIVVSTDDGPAGAAFAPAVSPSVVAASAPAAREVRRRFFIVVPFSSSCAACVVLLRNGIVGRVRCGELSSALLRSRPVLARSYLPARLRFACSLPRRQGRESSAVTTNRDADIAGRATRALVRTACVNGGRGSRRPLPCDASGFARRGGSSPPARVFSRLRTGRTPRPGAGPYPRTENNPHRQPARPAEKFQ